MPHIGNAPSLAQNKISRKVLKWGGLIVFILISFVVVGIKTAISPKLQTARPAVVKEWVMWKKVVVLPGQFQEIETPNGKPFQAALNVGGRVKYRLPTDDPDTERFWGWNKGIDFGTISKFYAKGDGGNATIFFYIPA